MAFEDEILERIENERWKALLLSFATSQRNREIILCRLKGEIYDEIGVKFGLSFERVRQIFNRSVRMAKRREFVLDKAYNLVHNLR